MSTGAPFHCNLCLPQGITGFNLNVYLYGHQICIHNHCIRLYILGLKNTLIIVEYEEPILAYLFLEILLIVQMLK